MMLHSLAMEEFQPMPDMQRVRSTPRPADVSRMTTEELRGTFLIEKVFNTATVAMTFTDLDRMAVGGIAPSTSPVPLNPDPETGSEFFLARREMGVINVGGPGVIVADGKKHELANLDCLYIGMGARSVTFQSAEASKPAKFFLLSTPAHHRYETSKATQKQANPVAL